MQLAQLPLPYATAALLLYLQAAGRRVWNTLMHTLTYACSSVEQQQLPLLVETLQQSTA